MYFLKKRRGLSKITKNKIANFIILEGVLHVILYGCAGTCCTVFKPASPLIHSLFQALVTKGLLLCLKPSPPRCLHSIQMFLHLTERMRARRKKRVRYEVCVILFWFELSGWATKQNRLLLLHLSSVCKHTHWHKYAHTHSCIFGLHF